MEIISCFFQSLELNTTEHLWDIFGHQLKDSILEELCSSIQHLQILGVYAKVH